jgi:hypothetical protein
VYFQKLTGGAAQIVHYRGGAPASADVMAATSTYSSTRRRTRCRRFVETRCAPMRSRRPHGYPSRRHPDGRRSGHAGFYNGGLARTLGASRHAARSRRAAQLGNGRCRGDERVRKRLMDIGQEILPRDQQTPEALGAHHKAEIEKWWPIIKSAGIKAD